MRNVHVSFSENREAEYLKRRGKLSATTRVDVESGYSKDFYVILRKWPARGMLFHACNLLVSTLKLMSYCMSISGFIAILVFAELDIEEYAILMIGLSIFGSIGVIIANLTKGQWLDKYSTMFRFGYVYFSLSYVAFNPLGLFNKFYRSSAGSIFAEILRRVSFDWIRLDECWTIEYGTLLSIIEMAETDPGALREIVALAKDKEEFRQMIGVR